LKIIFVTYEKEVNSLSILGRSIKSDFKHKSDYKNQLCSDAVGFFRIPRVSPYFLKRILCTKALRSFITPTLWRRRARSGGEIT